MRLFALCCVLVASACPPVTPGTPADSGIPKTALTLSGSLCTAPSVAAEFPLKVMFIVDQSGSMCLSDPPGAQSTAGLCQTVAVPPGVTEPARTRMLRRALTDLAAVPSAQVGVITYEQNARKAFPPQSSMAAFGSPLDPALQASVQGLSSQLGAGGDLQGALAMAGALIQNDIAVTRQNDPASLPRTRYQLVLITDGTPSPRCSAIDTPPFATAVSPELRWADSDSTFCNTVTSADPQWVTGFIAGSDRNQNQQLFAELDALAATAEQARVGALQLNVLMVTNADTHAACGAVCDDLYPPDSSNPSRFEAARLASRWLLDTLARRLDGTLTEFRGNAGNTDLAAFRVDATTLHSPNVLKGFHLQLLSSTRRADAFEVDSDGDGLTDAEEAAGTAPSNPNTVDTDGDGFDDSFEAGHRAQGFDPQVKDARGCDPASAQTPGCSSRDTDGDGLSQFAEAWLATATASADFDGDGIPDGLEVRHGLDPTAPNFGDSDGDTVTDAAELQLGTDPLTADAPLQDARRVSVALTLTTQDATTSCYDFAIDNLPLQATAGQPAYYKVWAGEDALKVSRAHSVWRAACARAQKTDDGFLPADLNLSGLTNTFFKAAKDLTLPLLNPGECLSPAGIP